MARRSLFSGSENLGGVSFLGIEQHVEARLRGEVEALTKEVASRARANLSGTVLHTRRGRLLRSVKTKQYGKPGVKVGGLVKAGSGRAFYGAFWERGFGGKTIRLHRSDKTRTVPEQKRPFLRPALDGMRATIRARLAEVVRAAAREAGR